MFRWTRLAVLTFAVFGFVGSVAADTLAELKTPAVVRAVSDYLKSAPADGPVLKGLAEVEPLVEVGKVKAAEGLSFQYDAGKKTGQFAWDCTAKKALDDSEKLKVGTALKALLSSALTDRKGDLKLDENSHKEALALVAKTNLTAQVPAVVAQPQPSLDELKKQLDEQKKQLAKNIEDQKNALQKLRDENNSQKLEMNKLTADLKNTNKSLDDQKKVTAATEAAKIAALADVSAQKTALDKAANELKEMTKSLDESNKKLATVEKEKAEALVKIAEQGKDLIAAQKMGDTTKTALAKTTEELTKTKGTLGDSQNLVKTLQAEKTTAATTIENQKNELVKAQDAQKETQKVVDLQKSEIMKVFEEMKKVTEEIKKLNKQFDDQKTMIRNLKSAYLVLSEQAGELAWWLELESEKVAQTEKKLASAGGQEADLREQLRFTHERLRTAEAEQMRLRITVSALTPRMTLPPAALFPSSPLPAGIQCAPIPGIPMAPLPTPFVASPVRMRIEYLVKCIDGHKVCVPTLVAACH